LLFLEAFDVNAASPDGLVADIRRAAHQQLGPTTLARWVCRQAGSSMFDVHFKDSKARANPIFAALFAGYLTSGLNKAAS
jgi:hypothetical protein